jgi:hypothetical protein
MQILIPHPGVSCPFSEEKIKQGLAPNQALFVYSDRLRLRKSKIKKSRIDNIVINKYEAELRNICDIFFK